MFKYWDSIKKSTVFKLGLTAAVSFALYQMAAFLLPLLLAIGLSFALYPVVNMISKIKMGQGTIHLSRVVAIILSFVTFGVFIFIVIGFIILPFFGQMNELLVKMPMFLAKAESNNINLFFNETGKYPQLPSSFGMLLDEAVNLAMIVVSSIAKNLVSSSIETVKNLVGLIIVPFLSFYFLKDWRELRSMVINLFNYEDQPKAAHVIDEIGRTLSAYIQGLGKLSLIAGFCVTLGTVSLGVDFPLVFGFLAIIAETIPVVGPIICAVPAIFIAYAESSTNAFYVALFYIIFYQLDANFIMPKIMGKKIDVHPVVLILSLLIGAKLFGIVGMFFAVPVAAVYRVLYKELWHEGERVIKNEKL